MLLQKNQSGFSMIELMVVVVVVMIIATLAIPNLLAARRTANEASAIQSLRNYHSAQVTYQTTLGNGDYAGSADGSTNGFNVLSSADLIDPELGSGIKSGYFFFGLSIPRGADHPASFVGVAPPTTFMSSATGFTAGEIAHTGSRVFIIQTDGVTRWESINGLAGPNELTMQLDITDGAFAVTGGSILGD